MKESKLDNIRDNFDLFGLTEYEDKFVAISKKNNHKTIRKIKNVTPEWLKGKIEKWQNRDSNFKNLRSLVRKKLNLDGRFYATSFGISYDCMMVSKSDFDDDVDKVEQFLEDNDIEYRTEFSDANWVYRFRLSKSKENIERIKKLSE